MNEHAQEEDLALYATEDLEMLKAWKIKQHLETCPTCQQCLKELQRSQKMLQQLRTEPAQEDLLQVRRNIMARIQPQRSSDWRWKWCVGLASVAAVLILLFHLNRPTAVYKRSAPEIPPPIALQPEIKSPAAGPVQRAKAVPTVRRRFASGLHSAVLITQTDEPPLIRLNTSDPNVVILLQTGELKIDERTQDNE